MRLDSKEAVGVRCTGRAALDRDPQQDVVEYICPYCGAQGVKSARRAHLDYHFTDGFMQDLQGEVTTCRGCKHSVRIVPVVMVHDSGEKRRFDAMFSDELIQSKN